MRLRNLLAIGLLGLGVTMTPVVTSTLRAEDPPKEQPKHHSPAERLKHFHATVLKLNLTDEQKPKIESAFTEAKAKVEAAVKDGNGDHDAIKAKIGPIMKELGETVHGILTPDQQAELKKAHGGDHPKHEKPPAAAAAK